MKSHFICLWLGALAVASSGTDQPRAVLFLHLRKCGGSSVGNYLREWLQTNGCGPGIKLAPYFMASPVSPWLCSNRSAAIHFREIEYQCLVESFSSTTTRLRSLKTLPNHPLVPFHSPLVLSIIILRHPIDRIISQWWYHGGAGHSMLQNEVVNYCEGSIPAVREVSSKVNATLAVQKKHPRKPNFQGILESSKVKSHACYKAALETVRQRSASEASSETHGAQWWSQAYLDKDVDRLHLFRSLHAQYVDNYAVRRLAASSTLHVAPPPLADNRDHAVKAQGPEIEDAQREIAHVGSGDPSESGVALLSSFRQRCNLRGRQKLGMSDYSAALRALEAFDVVLLTEWLDVHHDSMIRILLKSLGAGAPLAFAHARTGISSATTRPSSSPFPPWSEEGKGSVWRAEQAPQEVITRLYRENELDLDLYHQAARIALLKANE